MSASAAPVLTDRSDFRNVTASGAKLGALTGAVVVVFLVVSRLLSPGVAREAVQALVVIIAAPLVSLLPARWTAPRSTEGIAGAAAVGLVGTVVFSMVDIVVLRPFHAYPWTWDAVGGGSTWWYLPIWWMLGTFVAWMGGMLSAARAARGTTEFAPLAMPLVASAVIVTIVARLGGCPVILPVMAGAAYALTLTVLAVAGIVRKG
jgi:hypothetical protein